MSESRERRVVRVVRPAPESGLQPERAVRALCREALTLRSALEMDCWISSLLGQIWEQRGAAPPVTELDRTFALGVPMMEQIARYGGPGARLLLHAVASVDRGGLGVRCGQLAQELSRQRLPRWARHLGSVTLSGALIATVPGDGEVIFLQASGGGRSAHSVGVHRPAPGWDRQAHRAAAADRRMGGRRVRTRRRAGCGGGEDTAGTGGERLVEAIRRADECEEPVLGETFVELRALALARAGSRRERAGEAAWLN